MADDLVTDGDPRRALERLLRQGFRTRAGDRVPGLRDLLERLRGQRRDLLDRHDLGDVLGDLRRALEDVLDTERQGIDRRVEAARQAAASGDPAAEAHRQDLERIADERRSALDALPKDLGGAVRGLQDYQFVDPEAWRKFQELMLRLRQEMAQSLFGQLKQGLEGLGAAGTDALRDMMRDLNRLLRQQAAGGQPDVKGFMDRWGAMFPGVQSLDQLLEQLARQSAQLQSLLESLTPEQRQELEALQEALLGDPGLQDELAELGEHLDRLGLARRAGRYRTQGETPLSLQEALRLMGELHDLDRLEEELQDADRSGRADRLDAAAIRRTLGEEAGDEAEALRRLAEALEASSAGGAGR
jgi:uncharacterized protein with von Willebrand factor type A (vWA) domain